MSAAQDLCPETVRRLRLDAPGWLEASAGSGKTYAIEHLVARLLRETRELSMPGILLVTFTEKAAGELKEKIRKRLEQESARPDLEAGARLRLQEAWLHFDRASVHTIHGFCLQCLRRYAFELGGLFEAALIGEQTVNEKALRDLRRQAAAGQLPEDLSTSLVATTQSGWQRPLREYAKAYRPERGDSLEPAPDAEDLRRRRDALHTLWRRLRDLLLPGADKELEEQFWFIDFKKLFAKKIATHGFNRRRDALLNLAGLLRQAPDNVEDWRKEFRHKKSVLASEAGRLLDLTDLPVPAPELQVRLDGLTQALNGLKPALTAEEAAEAREQTTPLFDTLLALGNQAMRLKQEQGLITYEDMAFRLWQALLRSPELAGLLRRQYPVAIVDEFQDTDPVQWAIFEKLYLDGPKPLPLYLVGDPKQAIYAFRGGDLATYLRARARIQDLARERKAVGLGLEANYRSRPELIEALNAAFSQADWFPAATGNRAFDAWDLPEESRRLTFTPARFGNTPRQHCLDQSESKAPVVLFQPHLPMSKPKVEDIRYECDNFVLATLVDLLSHPERLQLPDGRGGFRPMHAGDVCVLSRSHADKLALERGMRRLNIPFHVHKQHGLFRSDEAGHLAAVLMALAHRSDPDRQIAANLSALLCDYPEPYQVSDVMHPLLEDLAPLAEEGRWSALFRRLFRQGSLRHRLSQGEDGVERLGRYRQLVQRLCHEAQAQGLDALGLANALNEWRHQPEDPETEDQGDAMRAATETPKVTLLTMHASKGLEFPVVFIAYGSGGSRLGLPRLRHEHGLGRTFFLGELGEAAAVRLREETIAENKRLFYVALTRAQYKLFLPLPPLVEKGKGKEPPPALASFVGLALRAAMQAQPHLFHLHAGETPLDIAGLNRLPDAKVAPISSSAEGEDPAASPLPRMDKRSRRLASYSQLALGHKAELLSESVADMLTEEGRRLRPDEGSGASVTDTLPKERPLLPPGARTGNLLHACLENLDFAWAMSAENGMAFAAGPAREILLRLLREHRFDEDLLPELGRLLHATLTTPLDDPGGGEAFRLGEVREGLPELEFMLPYGSALENAQSGTPPETLAADGYLWGYIDLVFRHRGRTYVLDWKSNWLTDYRRETLHACMRESAYDLQGKLYAFAVHRWLRSRQPDYDPASHFGGVFYLFLRGLGQGSEGIYAWRPSSEDLEHHYPSYLAQTLKVAGSTLQSWVAPNSKAEVP